MKKKIIKEPPRMNSFKSETPIRPFRTHNKKIKSVRLVKLNIDDECNKDLKSNNGFFITNEEDFDEKRDVRTEDGLYSPKFGIDTFTDKNTDNLFHCECGKLSGGLNEGDTCPECGTRVVFTDSKLNITGYINLGNYCIINPACYTDLESLIGAKELTDIIKFNNKFNVNGKKVSTKNKKSPWNGIGLIEFRNQFDEIVEYYRQKRKKESHYKIIKQFRDSVFAHNVPVYSSLLRPLVKEDSRIAMFDVNRSYSVILANANSVRALDVPGVDKSVIIENCLYEIQTEANKISNDIITQNLSGKKGIIRGMTISSRMDYSARFVVVPAIGHCVNEVSLPYAGGCELFRPLLINALHTIDGINIREANTIIDKALRKFDKKIFLLMNHILQNSDNPPMIMVQRSPSLLQESMRLMHIKQVKADINDLTLDVPVGILSLMNADFDGDTFAAYMIYDNRLKDAWAHIHCPDCHFISRHDGKYSEGGEFIKDSAVILSELWEIGKNSCYYDGWASESERNKELSKCEFPME